MAKSTIPQVYSQIDTLLADNTVGAITPQKLRDVLKLLGDALKPSFVALTNPSMAVTGLSATPKTLVGFTSKATTDTTDADGDIALGKITRPNGGSCTLSVSGTILTTANKVMTLSILRGATVIRTVTFRTDTTVVAFFLDAPDFIGSAAEYTVTLAGNSTTATLGNLLFTLTSNPTL